MGVTVSRERLRPVVMTLIERSRLEIRVARVLEHLRSEFRELVVAAEWRVEEDYAGGEIVRAGVELRRGAKLDHGAPLAKEAIREYIRSAFRISGIEIPPVVDFRQIAKNGAGRS
jgi:hypothetical protein